MLDSTTSIDSLIVPAGKLQLWIKYYWHVRAINAGGSSSYSAVWNFTPGLVGITNNGAEIPKVYKLYVNYPNPFNPVTKIKFDIPKSAYTEIKIYDNLGREIYTLVSEEMTAGKYETDWNASNYPSGVYYYKLTSGDYSDSKKMVLVK